jgi:hypothetical protein
MSTSWTISTTPTLLKAIVSILQSIPDVLRFLSAVTSYSLPFCNFLLLLLHLSLKEFLYNFSMAPTYFNFESKQIEFISIANAQLRFCNILP